MKIAAIYARVSPRLLSGKASDQQKEEKTQACQTAALIEFARQENYQVLDEWVFEDEGYSGIHLMWDRPGWFYKPVRSNFGLFVQTKLGSPLCHGCVEKMKLKFKLQAYQSHAVEAVADCFAGQMTTPGIQYHVDPDRAKKKTAVD